MNFKTLNIRIDFFVIQQCLASPNDRNAADSMNSGFQD